MSILYKELSYKIIGIAMEVHRELGPGFLEKVYENAMMMLIKEKGIEAKQQYPIPVQFRGENIGEYFADIFVENKIILELKTVEKIPDIFRAKAIHYLKATETKLAIIINFKSDSLQYERIVL
ncbi:MAG: GxxExxY protein [Candidatus Marinimicrobia bacterium]|jgi:GxxExxY protein|nr:GxxExxY protein [Candidatus Neomarinimicrobiota bacterium]MDP6852769.1 GxxExxY protein [Candidatus Neomarinimicrobiota bacterium]MDP6936428.1 GxxExxY protein [Candidatus Neomarinimicrobiota bacterium]